MSSRWPASVYEVGEEPDPRFTLANERTLLAWIRTVMALLAAAVVLDTVPLGLPHVATSATASLLAVGASACTVQAWRGWARTERALRRNDPLPATPATMALTAGLAVLGLTLAVVVASSPG